MYFRFTREKMNLESFVINYEIRLSLGASFDGFRRYFSRPEILNVSRTILRLSHRAVNKKY